MLSVLPTEAQTLDQTLEVKKSGQNIPAERVRFGASYTLASLIPMFVPLGVVSSSLNSIQLCSW